MWVIRRVPSRRRWVWMMTSIEEQIISRIVPAGGDASGPVDIARQAIHQGGLARAGAARDQNVAAHATDDTEDLRPRLRNRAKLDQLIERQLILFEFADGERGAIDCERWHDHVHSRAVREPCVANRGRLVDATAYLAD